MNTTDGQNRELWHTIFAVGHPALTKYRETLRRIPSAPRCKLCFAPFGWPGSIAMRFAHREPSSRNPHYCNACDRFIHAYPGGAEVELSIAFVDVRHSTELAEQLGAMAFGTAMKAFYKTASHVFHESDGFVVSLIGDAVVALFPPGFCGPAHARKAIESAENLIRAKQFTMPDGSQVEVGVGVSTGPAFVGTMAEGPTGVDEVSALGESVNLAARLSHFAKAGEALISDATCANAKISCERLERREVTIAPTLPPVEVSVLNAATPRLIARASAG
jgi:adenylate cyclase